MCPLEPVYLVTDVRLELRVPPLGRDVGRVKDTDSAVSMPLAGPAGPTRC